MLKNVSYHLTEAQFATNDVMDPFAHAFVHYLQSCLSPLENDVSARNQRRLREMVVAVVVVDLLESVWFEAPAIQGTPISIQE
jgi:hypothetical protein